MAGNVTRTISLNRDNVVRLIGEQTFFDKIPGLQPIEQELKACRAAFLLSARERGCSCRADTSLLSNCLAALMQLLTDAKTNDPQTVQNFVNYVAKTDQTAGVNVTMFFRDPKNPDNVQQYSFP